MAGNKQIWGETTIRVDGVRYSTDGTSTLDIGGKMREAVEADNEAGFYSQKTKPARVEFSILVNGDISLVTLGAWCDAQVTFEADSGQTYIITPAYTVDTISVSDGKAKVIMEGPPAQEIRV